MIRRTRIGIATSLAALGLAGCAPTSQPPPTLRVSPTPSVMPSPVPLSPSPTPSESPGFQPEALSAISESDFWVLGTTSCTTAGCPPEILHTLDAGKTFRRIPAPPMVFLDGNPSTPGLPRVFDIRFADPSDGWVFGDQLWATHDGGAHWRQINLGLTVDQLEPGANGYVYAALENCGASGSPCVFRLLRSRAGSDVWSNIAPPGAPDEKPVIGVHGNTVWVMHFGTTGDAWISHDDGALWVRGSMPCERELIGSFDPVSASVIWAFCATGNFGNAWLSTNGGATFTTASGSVGKNTNGGIVVALSAQHAFTVDPGGGLQVTTDGGRSFRPLPQPADPVWGGFTDSEVGYLITRDPTTGAMRLWRTVDAGARWSVVTLA
jgi:photosystem II stability/assembly factor-like uncharacterized protein